MTSKNPGYLASRTEFWGAPAELFKMHETGTIPDRMYGIPSFYGYTCWYVIFIYLTKSSVIQQRLKANMEKM